MNAITSFTFSSNAEYRIPAGYTKKEAFSKVSAIGDEAKRRGYGRLTKRSLAFLKECGFRSFSSKFFFEMESNNFYRFASDN